MPRKSRSKKSQPKFKLPKLNSNFSQVVRRSWNKTVLPLRGAKLPPAVRRVPLAKNLTFGAIALLLLLILASLGIFIFGNQLVHAWQERTSAAVVNGEVISKGDLNRRLVQADGDQTVQRMVEETLVLQEGKKQNITVSQSEIQAEFATVEKNVAPQKLDDLLNQRHMTRSDLERQIVVKVMTEKLLGAQFQPTDKEISDYFNANKDSLAQALDTTADKLTLDEARSEAITELRLQYINENYTSWIDGLKAKSKIETFLST